MLEAYPWCAKVAIEINATAIHMCVVADAKKIGTTRTASNKIASLREAMGSFPRLIKNEDNHPPVIAPPSDIKYIILCFAREKGGGLDLLSIRLWQSYK